MVSSLVTPSATAPAVNVTALATELAVKLLPTEDILKQFGLTAEQLRDMLRDQQFRQMISQIRADWNAATNSKERVRLKAALSVEENLLTMHQIVNNTDLHPGARIDAFKQLKELADVAPKTNVAEGTKFTLNIALQGQPAEKVVIDAQPQIPEGDIDAG